MLRALGDYGRLMVFPSNLHMERSVSDPALSAESGWLERFHPTRIPLLGRAAFVWRCLPLALSGKALARKPAYSARAGSSSPTLPISNLFDLNATVAEHWLYLPSVGFLIFFAGCRLRFARAFSTGHSRLRLRRGGGIERAQRSSAAAIGSIPKPSTDELSSPGGASSRDRASIWRAFTRSAANMPKRKRFCARCCESIRIIQWPATIWLTYRFARARQRKLRRCSSRPARAPQKIATNIRALGLAASTWLTFAHREKDDETALPSWKKRGVIIPEFGT